MANITSQWMTKLIVWRNPQGEERNWLGDPEFRVLPSPGTRALAECGFLGIAVVAAIVTVWHGLIVVLLRIFAPDPGTITFGLMHREIRQYRSSAFVVIWSGANLVLNFIHPNLPTTEVSAREHGRRFGVWI
ncbi:MAG: hypothetical protein V4487_02955 [Chlamydiota bacterium]